MAVQAVNFWRDDMPTALTTVHTAKAAKGADVVGFIEVVNSSGSEVQVWVYIVPSGGAADVGNVKIPGKKLASGAAYNRTGWWPLAAGDTVQAKSVGTQIALEVSGIRRTA